jgi:hypothetical protein
VEVVELGLWEEWRRCESHQSLNRIPFGRRDGMVDGGG